jgi:hypothetical protein
MKNKLMSTNPLADKENNLGFQSDRQKCDDFFVYNKNEIKDNKLCSTGNK